MPRGGGRISLAVQDGETALHPLASVRSCLRPSGALRSATRAHARGGRRPTAPSSPATI